MTATRGGGGTAQVLPWMSTAQTSKTSEVGDPGATSVTVHCRGICAQRVAFVNDCRSLQVLKCSMTSSLRQLPIGSRRRAGL